MFVAHSQFLTFEGDVEGELQMQMLKKTPIRVYEMTSGKLLSTFMIEDLSVQDISYVA